MSRPEAVVRRRVRSRTGVHVVIAGWEPDQTAATCQLVDANLQRNGVMVRSRTMVTEGGWGGGAGYDTLQGDNSGLDLGRLGHGAQQVLEHAAPGECLLLVNDRVPHYETKRPLLGFMVERVLRHVAGHQVLGGKVWEGESRYAFDGRWSRSWVQSHCLLIGAKLARRIELPAVLRSYGEGSLRFQSDGALHASPNIDPAFVRFLEQALVLRPDGARGWTWAGAQATDRIDTTMLDRKALAILRERVLSAAALAAGGQLLDLRSACSDQEGKVQFGPRLWWGLTSPAIR